MKKIFKVLALVAASAMGFTACQEEIQGDDYANDGTVVVSFVTDTPETKTSVDTSGETPVFAWDAEETFVVLEQTDALAKATSVAYAKVDGKAKIDAEFASNPGKETYDYVTIYPASGYASDATTLAEVTLNLPAEQAMTTGSYDPAADLMVSEVVNVNAQPTEAQMVAFTRLAAVAEMTLKNLDLEAGDEVEKVIFTAEGKELAGTVTVNLNDPHVFTDVTGVDNVSVSTTSSKVFFTVLPTTLEAGDQYTVTVITDKYLYVKNGTIPAEKSLVFEAGMVTRFGADMAGIVPSDKWVLVKDASTLKTGDVVTIAAKNYNYVVGKQGNNYPFASQTEVKKIGDYLYHPIATKETTVDNRIQHYTLLKRDNERTAFDFYNDIDYEGDTSVGFVFAYGTNNSPKLQSWCDKNTLFDVEITDGVSTLKASEITGTYKWWRYYHSNYASSRKFDCTASAPTGNNQICLYKLEGAVGTIPVIDANVTKEDVVIPEEGAQIATKIEEVVFNYVGDWNISVSDNADWLEVTYDSANNCLKYTAQENTSGKRDATVTITAALDGQDDITWPFTVTQKGAPTLTTIADLKVKEQDLNTVYKLTGRVKSISTSSSSGNPYTLEDENGSTIDIKYLYTDGGAQVYNNAEIGLAVGDVVTVTTIVYTQGTGGHKDYRSIYKGHYRLVASADAPVDYEGGSVSVNVAVQKFGHIVAPSAISVAEVTMGGNPFTNYTFTDNGNGTATAVVTFDQNTTSGTREVSLNFSAGSPLAVATSVSVMQDVDPALKKGWWLVTDVNDLKAGDKIIIAATGLDYAISTAQNTNNRKSTAITKVGSALANVSGSVQQYALEIVDGLYAFKGTIGTDANKYIYAPGGDNNYLKVKTTLEDDGKWTIEIASDGGATIIAPNASGRNKMQYNNKVASSPGFYCTDGTQGVVCLYKFY